ncbi:MAG: OsmC family protein [Gemmatimonadaceae bacterium]|nr:OsmC family protein [Gemmatimonadaceae bacterium]
MKITLLADDALRLEPMQGPMTIEAPTPDRQYSPFDMLASGLAYCTWSVLASWASNAGLGTDDLTIEVRWTFAEGPHRVGALDLRVQWPSLPAARDSAAQRVAALCAVHATLTHSPAITTAVVR